MFLANSAWNLLMPFHCYLLLQGDGSSDQGSNMPFYHAYAWSLATFFTALLFIVQKVKGGLAIGNATLECWISDEFKEYRIWLFYLWLWLQFACMIALYVVVWHKVKAMTGRQRNAASDAIAVGRQRMLRKAMALAVGFSITWIPASASRIVGALGYEVPYWLFVLQSLTMPAHGLSDSMIFLAFAYSKQSSDGAARHDVAGDAVRMASLSERSKGAVQIELMRRNK
ncbi:hypothetical protein BC830DRAFT_1087776 [Chytriomyces sp. MP71]|nr:hypothetical protein BC830DRAFT_1087776 [Chytriomyces sp. MP71]